MALIRKKSLREMPDAELQTKLFDFQKELNTERGLLASGGRSSNTGKARELRRAVARIITILHERKLGIERKIRLISKPAAKAQPKEAPPKPS